MFNYAIEAFMSVSPEVEFLKDEGKDGKLNARHYIGGSRFRLSDFQTEYHEIVEGFGLERGIQGSKATHMDIKKSYN